HRQVPAPLRALSRSRCPAAAPGSMQCKGAAAIVRPLRRARLSLPRDGACRPRRAPTTSVQRTGPYGLCENRRVSWPAPRTPLPRTLAPWRDGSRLAQRGAHTVSNLDQVTLNAGDKSVTLPVLKPTLGNDCIDVSKLTKETGLFTYDFGFTATASCKSAITYIDGDNGVLLYRGYPIEQLAEHSSFLEVAYLLMNGELPTEAEFKKFEHEVTHHTMMHESLKNFLQGFNYDAHPMAMLAGSVASLSAFYHDTLDLNDPEQRRLAAIRLLAKMPTLAAAAYRYSIGWPIRYPRNNLDYVSRFLHMMFEVPSEPLELNPVVAKALDLLFILHADHEQNASTSTVRLVGSTGANPYASVAAGITALWGPAHGGANEAVLKMLEEIGDAKNV